MTPRWRGVQRPRRGELLVSEVFGPTIQGEGPSAGRAAGFLRLGVCNLACQWCDSAFTWDASSFDLSEELSIWRSEDLVARFLEIGAPLVVITGGEPALQATEAAAVSCALRSHGIRVELETSGSVRLGPLLAAVDRIVASPKLANSGIPERHRLRWQILEELAASEHVTFKFVVTDPSELAEVERVVSRLAVEEERIWVMPEGTERDVLCERFAMLADAVAANGWSISSRLHILAWGDERGR